VGSFRAAHWFPHLFVSTSVKNVLPISPAILTVATTYAATPIASYQLAGGMLLEGLLTVKEVLIALFLGRVFFGIVLSTPDTHSHSTYLYTP